MICPSAGKDFLPVGVSTDVAVPRSRGGGTQCPGGFWRKKKTTLILCLAFTSVYRLLTRALMRHIFYTCNFYEKHTGWQLEPNLLLFIWITVLGCSPLWAEAGWHRGNLLARSPGSSLLVPSPSQGYRSRLCTGLLVSSRVSWEHWLEQLHFAPLIRLKYRCRCKVRLLCRRRDGRRWASCLLPLTGYEPHTYAGLTPASVCQTFFSAGCNCCFVATLTHD